jgi:hypothetical protein
MAIAEKFNTHASVIRKVFYEKMPDETESTATSTLDIFIYICDYNLFSV